ncbi:MAG: preprotein translocase subunit SecG [Chitinophagaceae bacterium]|nr:MAG: preprotein translocase subunit SecG [Chitinophagaceae bacterium]
MTILFLILVILVSVIIGFFILVQNPKGGGLAGNIAGFNSQFMGVKQTTDVLEKGTWVMAALIALLCIFSAFFIPKTAASGGGEMRGGRPTQTAPSTIPTTPAPAPAPATTPNP